MSALGDFCEKHGIRAIALPSDRNHNMADDEWARQATHWKVIVTYKKRRMTVPFSQGSAHTEAPTVSGVLSCVLSDDPRGETFESWCSDFGYEPDSRKAERTYKLCVRASLRARKLLGELYEEAQEKAGEE